MNFLKKHPFAVEAFFERSIVLTFALPKADLEKLIPPCLQLDTFDDQWAFLAVAMVQTKDLRPKGFPKFLGQDFFLTGYRVFVRYQTNAGKNLRGLYILRSETDKRKMVFVGNMLTHYNYRHIDLDLKETTEATNISSLKSNLEIEIDRTLDGTKIQLPLNSPFADWKQARRYAGPLPFTFTYDESEKTVLNIEGVRENWKPTPIQIKKLHVGFLEELQLEHAILANAFEIKNIPYHWKKGKTEKWKQHEDPFKAY